MWGSLLAFADYIVSNHIEFFVGGMVWLWHHIAGNRADALTAKLKEIALAAWNLAAHAADQAGVHVELGQVLGRARQLAHDKVAQLKLPMSASILALVDHELDVVAGEAAAAGLNKQIADVADQALDTERIWADAEARGKAVVADIPNLVTTEVVPQNAALPPQTTDEARATLDAPSTVPNAASSLQGSGSTDAPSTATPPPRPAA